MKLNPDDQKAGIRWLFGAGACAVLLSLGLMKIDDYLTNSDKEQRLGRVLYELRLAQTNLTSGSPDDRQSAASAETLEQHN